MNQLEELFNERLANHSVPPPSGSWERVAANLSKKNKTIVWVRWAAALIIGALAVSIITIKSSDPVDVLSDSNESVTPSQEIPRQKKPVAAPLANADKKVEKKVLKKKQVKTKTDVVTEAVAIEASPEPVAITAPDLVEKSHDVQPTVQPTAESKVAARSMVITYTLDPVVAVTPELPVADTKKGTSLEKVVKFARDVKNGDSPIGLRVVKEDLLAQSKKKSPTKTH